MIRHFVFRPPGPLPSPDLISQRSKMVLIEEPHAVIYYIHIKFRPRMHPTPTRRMPLTILYSHGNAEDLGTCYEKLLILSCQLGVNIVVYDYCGYGFSREKGSTAPSEERVYKDADAMFAELTGPLKIEPSHIVLMGRSMGGGPACYLAEKHHSVIGGLILLSTFTSCLGAVGFSCLRYLCVQDMFPNEKFLKSVGDSPVLIMHGENDTVVSFSCAERLLEVVEEAHRGRHDEKLVSHYWFENCDHDDIEVRCMDILVKVIKSFLDVVESHNDRRVVRLLGS